MIKKQVWLLVIDILVIIWLLVLGFWLLHDLITHHDSPFTI